MDRRQLLKALGVCGLGAAVAGTYGADRVWARSKLRQQLLQASLPLFAQPETDELQRLPTQARKQLVQWFHAPCCNAAEFVYDLCSAQFQQRLRACPDANARHELVSNLFVSRVVSVVEITEQVETIAVELGNDLDRNWIALRGQLLHNWRLQLPSYQKFDADTLVQRIRPLVDDTVAGCIDEACQQTDSLLAQRESRIWLGLGAKALLLIPAAHLSGVVWPWFVLGGLWQFAEWYWESLIAPIADLQAAVTSRVATLARRLGNEFHTEIRTRVADLHHWRQQAVINACDQLALEEHPRWLIF